MKSRHGSRIESMSACSPASACRAVAVESKSGIGASSAAKNPPRAGNAPSTNPPRYRQHHTRGGGGESLPPRWMVSAQRRLLPGWCILHHPCGGEQRTATSHRDRVTGLRGPRRPRVRGSNHRGCRLYRAVTRCTSRRGCGRFRPAGGSPPGVRTTGRPQKGRPSIAPDTTRGPDPGPFRRQNSVRITRPADGECPPAAPSAHPRQRRCNRDRSRPIDQQSPRRHSASSAKKW